MKSTISLVCTRKSNDIGYDNLYMESKNRNHNQINLSLSVRFQFNEPIFKAPPIQFKFIPVRYRHRIILHSLLPGMNCENSKEAALTGRKNRRDFSARPSAFLIQKVLRPNFRVNWSRGRDDSSPFLSIQFRPLSIFSAPREWVPY